MWGLSVVVLALVFSQVDSKYDPVGSLAQKFRDYVSEALSASALNNIMSTVFYYDIMQAMNEINPPYTTLNGTDQTNYQIFANATQNNKLIAGCYAQCYNNTAPYVLKLRNQYFTEIYDTFDGQMIPDNATPITGRFYNQHFNLKWAKGAASLCRSGCNDTEWAEVKRVLSGIIKFDKLGV